MTKKQLRRRKLLAVYIFSFLASACIFQLFSMKASAEEGGVSRSLPEKKADGVAWVSATPANTPSSPTPTTTPTPTLVRETKEAHRYENTGQEFSGVGVLIESEINRVFGKHAPIAMKIVQCESSFRANATNDNRTWGGKGVDRGYWQINTHYHPTVTLQCAQSAKCSTEYAYKLFRVQGTNPWNSSKKCWSNL